MYELTCVNFITPQMDKPELENLSEIWNITQELVIHLTTIMKDNLTLLF